VTAWILRFFQKIKSRKEKSFPEFLSTKELLNAAAAIISAAFLWLLWFVFVGCYIELASSTQFIQFVISKTNWLFWEFYLGNSDTSLAGVSTLFLVCTFL